LEKPEYITQKYEEVMTKWTTRTLLSISLGIVGHANAGLIGLDLIENTDNGSQKIIGALLNADSGINVVAGSEVFFGQRGEASAPGNSQSGIFSGVNISNGTTSVNLGQGAILTTGTANVPDSNTSAFFGQSVFSGPDADLEAILIDAGAPNSNTDDVNFISFDFTLAAGLNAVAFDFIFGSDEFPDQSVTDVFGFFIDGINFAFFPDNSLVSFVQGANETNFISNIDRDFNIEYDGFSKVLNVVGKVNTNLSTHTLKIAIADTSDTVYDSAVMLSNLTGLFTTGGGGVGDPPSLVSAPTNMAFFALALFGLGFRQRLKTKTLSC
jgi:hypothetical protein